VTLTRAQYEISPLLRLLIGKSSGFALKTGPAHSRASLIVAARSIACWALHDHDMGPKMSYPTIAIELLGMPGAHASALGAARRIAFPDVQDRNWLRIQEELANIWPTKSVVPTLPPAVVIDGYYAARTGRPSLGGAP